MIDARSVDISEDSLLTLASLYALTNVFYRDSQCPAKILMGERGFVKKMLALSATCNARA